MLQLGLRKGQNKRQILAKFYNCPFEASVRNYASSTQVRSSCETNAGKVAFFIFLSKLNMDLCPQKEKRNWALIKYITYEQFPQYYINMEKSYCAPIKWTNAKMYVLFFLMCVSSVFKHLRLGISLQACLLQIVGYRNLIADVEKLRREPYDSDNPQHEEMLLKVRPWTHFCAFLRSAKHCQAPAKC